MKKRGDLGLFRVLICISVLALCASTDKSYAREDAVVKVFTVYNEPNYDQPWEMNGQLRASGTGCVIAGQRIVTSAHVVSNQTFVQVQRVGDPEKYVAKVEIVGHEPDLALLSVGDPSFFEGLSPLSMGGLPSLRDTVTAYGFPIGGDKLSITEGVVSRIEMASYAHSMRKLLSVQIDAPINPGNSGGPVLKDGKVVGIVHQGLVGAENVGYMIPPLIVKHFLEDVRDGKYDGFPFLGIRFQKLENPSYREYLGMGKKQTGVVVSRVSYGSSAWGAIEAGDVILEIDGIRIANDGTVPFGRNDRLDLHYLLIQKHIGETVEIKIMREKQVREVSLVLKKRKDLVPRCEYDVKPTYYIFGGIVFTRLTLNYLNTWESWRKAPAHLVNHYLSNTTTPERQEIVMLRYVLADSVNSGYHDFEDLVVEKINGRSVSGMRELVEIIENTTSPYLEVELENKEKIVLDIEQCKRANADILKRYVIPADRSDNLKG